MPEPGVRQVALPDGRTVTVRPSRPEDADALLALYGAMSEEDRYRRFLTGAHPKRRHLLRWGGLAEQGGVGLVAETATGELVGEAGYRLLADGTGDFALAVAAGWRGWLGPYLLDALVTEAAARGVVVLRADVLVQNRPVLAVVGARGMAGLPGQGPVLSLVIGTTGRVPPWPPEMARDRVRTRVVVEVPGARWPAAVTSRAAGIAVLACPGPGAAATVRTCPALSGRPCPLVSGADAVVVALPPADPRTARLLEAHARLHPGVPLLVQADPGEPVPDGAAWLPAGSSPEEAVAVLRQVLRARGAGSAARARRGRRHRRRRALPISAIVRSWEAR